jgi:hypothetical protein
VKSRLKVKQMNLSLFIDLFASIYTCTQGTASQSVGSEEAVLEVPW